jgi:lysophospholipase L1-like esterase
MRKQTMKQGVPGAGLRPQVAAPIFVAAIAPLVLSACAVVSASSSNAGGDEHWVATWSASPMAADSVPGQDNSGFSNQTVRQVIHVSLGGRRLRVRLSNAYGTSPLNIGAAHVALKRSGASIVAGSDRAIAFNGSRSVTVPAGATMLSDPIDFEAPASADLVVSIHFPGSTGPITWHQLGMQTTYVSIPGDFTAATEMPLATTTTSRFVLSNVEVAAAYRAAGVVALGDSITDGYCSTLDANHRWPDYLSRRLNANNPNNTIAILNQGISGNRLLHDKYGQNSLARYDRDVLTQTGVTHVIVLEGINDIGAPGSLGLPAEEVGADEIISGLRQLIERAHERKLVILGGTLTPFEGTIFPGYYTAAGETKRKAVNTWIRTKADFDAVIDFDQVVRDPGHPTRLLPAYDCGDHLHLNDAGYEAMADSINLNLLRAPDSIR